MSQVFSSEATLSATNQCLQIMGGLGYMKSHPCERHVRDSRVLSIYEVCVIVCNYIFLILYLQLRLGFVLYVVFRNNVNDI